MTSLDGDFAGIWHRIELHVDSTRVTDHGHAHWFQARAGFIDIRSGATNIPSQLFAGTTTWDPDRHTLTWHRHIDRRDSTRPDRGRIEWRGSDLVEHGSLPLGDREVPFTEVWRRTSAPDQSVALAHRTDGAGRLCQCGTRLAVLIDDRADGGAISGASFSRREDETWVVDVAHGDIEPPPTVTKRPLVLFGHTWDWIT